MPKSKDKPVFDVSKPGKSAPSATSRPIITSHGPMLKDPMVTDDKEAEEKPVSETPKPKTSSKVITPVDSTEDESKVEVSVTKPDKQKPADDEKEEAKPAEVAETKTEEADKPTETEEATDSTTAAPAEDIASPAVGQALENQPVIGPTKEEIARQQQIEGLTEAETYFLPIGQVTRRRNNRRALVVLLVVLLLGLVGGYAALDAGVVESSFELPFDLIKN